MTDSFLYWASKPDKCKWTLTFRGESWHSLSISFEHGFWKAFQHRGMIGVLTVALFQKHDSAATALPIYQFCSYQPQLQLQLQLSAILQLSASVAVAVISHFAVISLSYHRLQLSFREKTCRQALEGQHGEKCRNSRVLRTIDEFPQIASLVIVMTTFLVSFLCFFLLSAIFWDVFHLATVVWSIFAWQGFEHP